MTVLGTELEKIADQKLLITPSHKGDNLAVFGSKEGNDEEEGKIFVRWRAYWGLLLGGAFQWSLWGSENSSFDCLQLLQQQQQQQQQQAAPLEVTYAREPWGDFELRKQMPQTEVPAQLWCHQSFGSFGPCPTTYPPVVPLLGPGEDPLAWARERVIRAAKIYLALPYAHRHIPALGGLDCSNYTAWVYNFAFGIRFSSHIERQSQTAGTLLDPDSPLEPGDLIFLWDSLDRERISHVLIYVDPDWVIDAARGSGIQLRPFRGKYKKRWAFSRRVISQVEDFKPSSL